jgi:RNA polymerase sigma-70 factor (ECF subfamily)
MESSSYEEFLLLYTQHQTQIWRFIHSMLPHESDADDVLQETGLVLWAKWDAYDKERNFGSWAFGIAKLQALKFVRENQSRRVTLTESVLEEVAESFHKQIRSKDALLGRRDAINKCLENLDQASRRIIEDRYRRNLSTKTIAERRGVAVQTVYSALTRVRSRLADCVQRRLAATER